MIFGYTELHRGFTLARRGGEFHGVKKRNYTEIHGGGTEIHREKELCETKKVLHGGSRRKHEDARRKNSVYSLRQLESHHSLFKIVKMTEWGHFRRR